MIRLYELPGHCWPTLFDHGPLVDRSSTTTDAYLAGQGYEMTKDPLLADIMIRKAELSAARPEYFEQEKQIVEQYRQMPILYLIGEPRELAPAAYRFADPSATLAVAPGNTFKRMTFGRPWVDPQLDNWRDRLDRICWIGRPIDHRVRLAQRIIDAGYDLDIYSRDPWPVSAWRGPAKNDIETARQYKFRIVCENSNQFGYHSEKLFTGIRSGCVNFYWADPNLDLKFTRDLFLPFTLTALKERHDFAPRVLERMNEFMFSNEWEVYSIRSFIDQMISLIGHCRSEVWTSHPPLEVTP